MALTKRNTKFWFAGKTKIKNKAFEFKQFITNIQIRFTLDIRRSSSCTMIFSKDYKFLIFQQQYTCYREKKKKNYYIDFTDAGAIIIVINATTLWGDENVHNLQLYALNLSCCVLMYTLRGSVSAIIIHWGYDLHHSCIHNIKWELGMGVLSTFLQKQKEAEKYQKFFPTAEMPLSTLPRSH